MNNLAERRGWCPGALRPMPTGDGLLLRLRLAGGALDAATARGVAQCARDFGNGALDLTTRANIHFRGVSEKTLADAQSRLSELGLLDADASSEAIRNIIASPMSDWDPAAVIDIRPVVGRIAERLVGDPDLRELPPKFCFAVDDGGAFPVRARAADVIFVAFVDASVDAGRPAFAVLLGTADGPSQPVGVCAALETPEIAARLARAFLDLRASTPLRRMAGGLRGEQAAALAQSAGLPNRFSAGALARPVPAPLIGFHDLGQTSYFGVGAPFGRLSAESLEDLAVCAEQFGAGQLRLTTSRAILIPGVTASGIADLATRLGGLIVDPTDRRLAVVACPGAPDCAAATTHTRADALALADIAPAFASAGVGVHLSGCEKRCARREPTPVTLIARDGLYDLVFEGAPNHSLRGVTIAAARRYLAAQAQKRAQERAHG